MPILVCDGLLARSQDLGGLRFFVWDGFLNAHHIEWVHCVLRGLGFIVLGLLRFCRFWFGFGASMCLLHKAAALCHVFGACVWPVCLVHAFLACILVVSNVVVVAASVLVWFWVWFSGFVLWSVCWVTFFMAIHVCLCLCFASADLEVNWFASAYREESLSHTSRV